jgi:PPOX class probable F420-dependent enzyme
VTAGEAPVSRANARPWLTPDLYAWLTAKTRYPVLATIGADGRPSLSVMWAIVEPDGAVVMNTAKGRRKYLDVLRDPRVSLCFEDRYEYVTLEGTVAMRDDPEFMDIERLRDHYADDSDFRSQGAARVTLLMSVRRVLTHFERLRGVPDPDS